jgi:hypothetical protein
MLAINEFLSQNNELFVFDKYDNFNGLLVLKKNTNNYVLNRYVQQASSCQDKSESLGVHKDL